MNQNNLSLSPWPRWSPFQLLLHITISFCLPWSNLALTLPESIRQSHFRSRHGSHSRDSREVNGLQSNNLFYKHRPSKNLIPNYITSILSGDHFPSFRDSRKHHSRETPENRLNDLQSLQMSETDDTMPILDRYALSDVMLEDRFPKTLDNKIVLPLLKALYRSSLPESSERQQFTNERLAKKPAPPLSTFGFSDLPFDSLPPSHTPNMNKNDFIFDSLPPSYVPNMDKNENSFSDLYNFGQSEGEWGPVEQSQQPSGFTSEGKFGPVIAQGRFVDEPYEQPWVNLDQRGFASEKLGSPSVDKIRSAKPMHKSSLFSHISNQEPERKSGSSTIFEGAFKSGAKSCDSIRSKGCSSQSDCECGGLYQCLNHTCQFVAAWSDAVNTELKDPIGGKWHDATFYKKRGQRSTSHGSKVKLGG